MQSSGISPDAQAKLRRGDAINALINQYRNEPVSIEDQIVYLNTLNMGLLDNLTKDQILKFRKEVCPFIIKKHPKFFGDLREARKMSPEMAEQLKAVVKEYIGELVR